jgi:menaquinone-dependent protoporphyrinogen oxidase
MAVLVAYASKYGATQQIAERIAVTLRASGVDADVRPIKAVGDVARYEAFVIGSAVYYGSWMRPASSFVRRHQSILAGRPVWLFSSGPIGADATDAEGRDMREVARPKQSAELGEALRPRDHRVFFGKLDHGKLGFADRLVASLPAFPGAAGDFRDWSDIEAWAHGIAGELAQVPAAGR